MTARIKRGFKLDKSGERLVSDDRHLNVSLRLKRKGKQKVRYGKRGAA